MSNSGGAVVSGGGGGGGLVAYDAAVLADGPVGYWPLDELTGAVAADASGNGHDGAYHGTYVLGHSGPCNDGKPSADLDGGGYVQVPDAGPLRITGPVTLEAWVQPSATPSGYQWLMTKALGASGTTFDWSLAFGGAVGALVRGGQAGAYWSQGAVVNAWSHVAAVWSTDFYVRLYLNGQINGLGVINAPITDDGAPLLLGARGDHYQGLSASLAKCAIYAGALTPQRILAHYLSGIGH